MTKNIQINQKKTIKQKKNNVFLFNKTKKKTLLKPNFFKLFYPDYRQVYSLYG